LNHFGSKPNLSGREIHMKSNLGIAVLAVALFAATATMYAPAQEPDPPARIYIYSGVLRSIDKQTRIIKVEHSAMSLAFVVDTDARIIVNDNAHGSLSDLMIGDEIEVQYTVEAGVNVAHQISLIGLGTS
jgi:hypothetical protein